MSKAKNPLPHDSYGMILVFHSKNLICHRVHEYIIYTYIEWVALEWASGIQV